VHAGGEEVGHLTGEHVPLDQLAERAERDAGLVSPTTLNEMAPALR
jgi:hypothetical protein